MEYVFDPQVYGETSLQARCMGSQHDTHPRVGDEAHSSFSDFYINRAFYKTADDH
jgi:hypothetical protein